jgi:gluconolactonase
LPAPAFPESEACRNRDDAPDLRLEEFKSVGRDLVRPECVLTGKSGTLWTSDRRAAVCRLDPDGRQELLGDGGGTPNGVARDHDGSLVVCDIERGTVCRLSSAGEPATMLAGGLGAPNFALFDESFQLWVTVSTRQSDRHSALASGVADGYVGRLEGGAGLRVAADRLGYTNEIRLDQQRGVAYVVESGRGRICRLPLAEDGTLGPAEPFGPDPLFPGAFPDGIALDSWGNLWVTELSRNALLLLHSSGAAHLLVADPEGRVLRAPSSIAFGGDRLTTAYVGSLELDHLLAFEIPWSGQPLAHWRLS